MNRERLEAVCPSRSIGQRLTRSLVWCSLLLAGCGGGSDEVITTDTDTPDTAGKGDYYSHSANCSVCHDGLEDPDGNDISIVTAWSSSMMANASRDPYWQAKVASELYRTPLQSDLLNDNCSRCHTPMANDSAKKDGVPPQIFDPGFLAPDNDYHAYAMDGVSCTLCHQIADNGLLGLPGGTSGRFEVVVQADTIDRPAYGEYASPVIEPMQNQVVFTPQQGLHTGTSELCASCHDLRTPTIDPAGNLAGTQFPEQMVFSEWRNSDFQTGGIQERSCQDCHMPELTDPVVIAQRPAWLTPRYGFTTHDMLGANTVMLDILDANRDELGVTALGFDRAIERNRAFLRTAATLEILSPTLDSGELTLEVKITNLTGHKLPTAYPSRRMYIHLLVQNASGSTLFESGKLNRDGSVVGIDLDEDPNHRDYEPHYAEISSEDQVQVYEPIMQDLDGLVTHTLLRAAGYVKDNRLTPSGFDKAVVADDVQVVGDALADDDFNNGSDSVTYRVQVGNASKLTVRAELNYQALSFGHLQNLFEDSTLAEVNRFKRMFKNAAIRAETIDAAVITLN